MGLNLCFIDLPVSDVRRSHPLDDCFGPASIRHAEGTTRRKQDLDIIRLEAGIERREPAQWDELRVWDPGDG